MTKPSDDSHSRVPVSIDRDGTSGIVIRWNDESESRWTAVQLRKACPCATCREKRKGDEVKQTNQPMALPVLSAAEAKPLSISGMTPVGTYAYNIAFSDGHSSGIFPFDSLYRSSD